MAFKRKEWKSGTVTEKAHVVIDGVKHEVVPATVENGDPITSDELNRMEQGIEDALNDVYSTEEQVIGTWLGKPLYRKVMQVEIPPTDADGTMAEVYYTVSNNIDKIIDIRGFANVDNRYSISFPLWTTTTNYKLYVRANGDNLLHILNYIKAFSGLSGMAIVEYTKTTD